MFGSVVLFFVLVRVEGTAEQVYIEIIFLAADGQGVFAVIMRCVWWRCELRIRFCQEFQFPPVGDLFETSRGTRCPRIFRLVRCPRIFRLVRITRGTAAR